MLRIFRTWPGNVVCRLVATALLMLGVTAARLAAQSAAVDDQPARDVLSDDQWRQVDQSVDHALLWLASRQQRNGSFPTLPHGQPGVTSLCVLAFAAHGHLPGAGPYGKRLEKAIEFIHSCQKQNGLLAAVAFGGATIGRAVPNAIGTTAAYNHGISALVLSEVYAVDGSSRADRNQAVIEKALRATLQMQAWHKRREQDRGGWRYVNRENNFDSDLSVTGWQLMFLRSAKNAGFDVPQAPIDEAVDYVRRCFSDRYHTFNYAAVGANKCSRAMAGAGVLALAHAGYHHSREAQLAGQWILENGFEAYNETDFVFQGQRFEGRYHYGLFNCSQAMYQLGGSHWRRFFPPTVKTLLANQRANGSWPADRYHFDRKFGSAYTTALTVLALGAPNQLLPIFQR